MTARELLAYPEFTAFLRFWETEKCAPFPLVDWLLDQGEPELATAVEWVLGPDVEEPIYPEQVNLGPEYRYFYDNNSERYEMRGHKIGNTEVVTAVDKYGDTEVLYCGAFTTVQKALVALLDGYCDWKRTQVTTEVK